jgi:hypothetical protein
MVGGMKIIALAALAAAFASPASAAERRYTVTDFDRVQVDGPFKVTLATGRASSAAATGSAQALDRVSIEVQGRTLRIRPNRSSSWGGYPGEGAGPVSIAISTHNLRGASVTGSGSISIDKAAAMRFDASVSGSGRLEIGNVQADMLTLGLLGAGRIVAGGKAKQLKATIQGNGDLEAANLFAEDAQINADTAGDVVVAVRRTAKVTASGSGDTKIIGSPSCTTQALGSGRVTCGKK